MKKIYQIIGLVVLMICSIVYDFQKPEVVKKNVVSLSYVILEGEFLKNGNNGYPIEDFLSEYTQEKIVQYCYYVATSVNKEDLPPLPTSGPERNDINPELLNSSAEISLKDNLSVANDTNVISFSNGRSR